MLSLVLDPDRKQAVGTSLWKCVFWVGLPKGQHRNILCNRPYTVGSWFVFQGMMQLDRDAWERIGQEKFSKTNVCPMNSALSNVIQRWQTPLNSTAVLPQQMFIGSKNKALL